VAGIGGPAGLKGSDGAEVQRTARERGSVARAGARAAEALVGPGVAIPQPVLSAGGPMGADSLRAAGFSHRVVWEPPESTTGADTTTAVAALVAAGAGLILFAGGDGTARDVAAGAGGAPMLGVPAGVKMYSDCFAVSPAAAGRLASRWLAGEPVTMRAAEVLDVDEEQLRAGRAVPQLHAVVTVPEWRGSTQARKTATPATERAQVAIAASGAVRALQPGVGYLLGPGGTTLEVARQLGLAASPLGVDVVCDGRLVLADASEAELLGYLDGRPARALVTVIGGQGFVLGRGNQQLSAAVLRRLATPDPLLVVASENKLVQLSGRPLLLDTGDPQLDDDLSGYLRVITGPNTQAIYPVAAATTRGESCD
ncbi:MAG: NAD(+)/NADH kinase, partial [Propionibacteriaceae bacterium]|nr:NAD(+)/NADH kinase [Propionibacteriaceae bacterium]